MTAIKQLVFNEKVISITFIFRAQAHITIRVCLHHKGSQKAEKTRAKNAGKFTDKLVLNNIDGNVIIKTHQEMFEKMQTPSS